jgi:hypothetical protein
MTDWRFSSYHHFFFLTAAVEVLAKTTELSPFEAWMVINCTADSVNAAHFPLKVLVDLTRQATCGGGCRYTPVLGAWL